MVMLYITTAVLSRTVEQLTRKRTHEAIVYWAGLEIGEVAAVMTSLAPKATTSAGSYQTTVEANADVIASLAHHQLKLLGQVHTHPGEMVDHSHGDDVGAFMPFEGFWSIVVPKYGTHGMTPLTQCGVHRYLNGRFLRLDAPSVDALVIVVPTAIDLR